MTHGKTALVIGATGMIGRHVVQALDDLDDWDTIGLARGAPDFETKAHFIAVDLSDPDSCKANLSGLAEITHIFFTGYTDRPTWAEQCAPNTALLVNALGVVEPFARGLRHVCLAQGSKYYGRHLGAHKTPAKEDDDRAMPPNFYYNQQDYLMELQAGKAWSWSCVRPQAVCGHALGFPLNLVPVIAVYATISKELGLPLRFPGKPGAYSAIYSVTDAELLARSMVWMATEPGCANEAFNITNGDVIRWQYTWPKIADHFGMEVGPVQEIDLIHMMSDKEALWDHIVAKHGLAANPFGKVVNWWFGNYAFGTDWDVISDTTKCRRHGFLEFVDTEEMFLRQFDALRGIKFIP